MAFEDILEIPEYAMPRGKGRAEFLPDDGIPQLGDEAVHHAEAADRVPDGNCVIPVVVVIPFDGGDAAAFRGIVQEMTGLVFHREYHFIGYFGSQLEFHNV